MNKSQLVDAMQQHLTDLTKPEISKMINAIADVITKTLKDGDSIALVGFGTFSAVKRAARIGRNPKTGDEFKIAETVMPKFKAGKLLREEVSGKQLSTPKAPKALVKTISKAPVAAKKVAKKK